MRIFPLIIIGVMALVAVVIVAFNWRRREPKPMMSESCVWVGVLSIPGVFAFLGGMGLLFYDFRKYETLGLTLAGVGFLLAVVSIILNSLIARWKRSAWPMVSARCVERTLQKHRSENSDVWRWHLVCEINFAGKTHRVIPKVRWSDAGQSEASFWSEAKAQAFISQAVAAHGECKLRVNPNNPQEAELLK